MVIETEVWGIQNAAWNYLKVLETCSLKKKDLKK